MSASLETSGKQSRFGLWNARLVQHHAGKILCLILLISALAFPGAKKLRLHANFQELLPPDHPSIVSLNELRSYVGGTSFIIAVFESPDEETARFAAETFSKKAAAFPGIDYVDNRTSMPAFENRKLLFLSLDSVHKVKQYVVDLLGYYRRKANPFFIDLLNEGEPVLDENTLELDRKVYRVGGFAQKTDASSMRVVLLKPDFSLTEFGKAAGLFDKCQTVFDEIQKQVQHPLTTGITGPYRTRYQEFQTVRTDLARTGLLTFLLISTIMIVAFRNIRSLLYAYIPLSLGLLWTGAFTGMTIGYLNLITAFLVCILIGMGSDYTLHLLVSLDDDMRTTGNVSTALEKTYCELWKPLLLSMLTTAAAFFAMTVSHFEGFRHFGIIAGVGIGIAFLVVFYGLPSLVVLGERYFPTKPRAPRKPHHVSNTVIYSILAAGLIFSVYSITQLPKSEFNYNFSALQPKGDDTIELAQRIGRHFGVELNPVALMTPSRERATEAAEEINRYIAKHPGETTFDFASALSFHIPRDQEEKINVLHEIDALLAEREAVIAKLDDKPRGKIEDLRKQLQATPFTFPDLPSGIVNQYEGAEGKISIVFVYPNESIMDGRVAKKFVAELRSLKLGPDVRLAGEPVIYADILRMLEVDTPIVMWISLATVIALLFLHFRRPDHVVWVLLPVVFGFLWMAGLTGGSGLKYNFFNMAILPSILGVGIDSGIYIFDRYKERRSENFFVSLQKTSKAVILSAATNLAAFVGLFVARHRGISSLGELGAFGFLACLLAAVYFVPAVVEFFELHARHVFKRDREA